MVALGLSLTAVAAVAVAVQGLRGGFSGEVEPAATGTATAATNANPGADFADATCEDFDLAAFEAIAASPVEPSIAIAAADTETGPGVNYCRYTADAGMTLDLTAVAATAEESAERTIDQDRQMLENASDGYRIEDFDSGPLTGYSSSYVEHSRQVVLLNAGAGRLLITVGLNAERGSFARNEALDLAETMAGHVLERFAAHR